jgi:hypothetical protein
MVTELVEVLKLALRVDVGVLNPLIYDQKDGADEVTRRELATSLSPCPQFSLSSSNAPCPMPNAPFPTLHPKFLQLAIH